jgi:hypothetical protein
MPLSLTLCVAVVFGASACETSTGTTMSSDAGTDASPAHCAIDRAFGDAGSCRAARYALECSTASPGASALCVSDDPLRCDTGTVGTSACASKCAANEYAAACSAPIGDGGTTQPPSTCRVLSIAPGGHGYYCCPCE